MIRPGLTFLPMRLSATRALFIPLMGAALFGALSSKHAIARAQNADSQASSGEIHVSDGWVRETVPGQRVGSAYMTFASADEWTLVRATTPVATHVEVHEMTTGGGVMRMRKVDHLTVRAGVPTRLQPGGLHFMLHGLKNRLLSNTRAPFQLVFRSKDGRHSKVAVEVTVRSLAHNGQHQQ